MIGHLAYASGSPCPTLVLDASWLPTAPEQIRASLARVRRFLAGAGGGHVLKMALVRPSGHPMFDLDYRFVQALPHAVDAFDLRGSCGHSILAATVAAARMGMLCRLTAGGRTRVRVLNNGDTVVCEVDRIDRDHVTFTIHFVRPAPMPARQLLLTGEPRTTLTVGPDRDEVSLVSAGNAYVFVDARSLGVRDHHELFAADGAFFARLSRIRAAAAERLGWSPEGVFPKIAALVPTVAGEIAARAISVPSWHPTIALTGAVCLASATRIPDSVPWRMWQEMGRPDGPIGIATPGGRTAVTAAVLSLAGEPALSWVSVDGKQVTSHGSFPLEPPPHLHLEEITACLATSATSA
ncbi:PrpF domain-containing protein [Micromonospora sp. NPDC006766]|uniref:PrpF domain-containing protein n=1 Tax=Micromonospora sp. NPDC006766 TaxID=3154778 RepID=UPI0033C587D0